VPIMPKACRPSAAIWVAASIELRVLADQVRNALEQQRGEFNQVADQQAAQCEQHGCQCRRLGDEGDGRFVQLGRGLHDTDHHAHHQHGKQQRAGHPQHGDQAATQFGQGKFGGHSGSICLCRVEPCSTALYEGYQAGLKYLNVAGINNLDLQVETNVVRPYVYTHFKTDQTWTHFNQPMAHPMGANFKEYLAIVRYQITPKWNVVAKHFNITHGADSTLSDDAMHFGGNISTTYANRPKDNGISIADGLLQQINITDIKVSYQIYQRTFIDVRFVRRSAVRDLPLKSYTNNIFLVGFRMNIASERMDFFLSSSNTVFSRQHKKSCNGVLPCFRIRVAIKVPINGLVLV